MTLTELLVVMTIILMLASMTIEVVGKAIEKAEYGAWVAYKSNLKMDPACSLYLDFQEGPGGGLPKNTAQCTNIKRYKTSALNAREIAGGGPFGSTTNAVPTWTSSPAVRRWPQKHAMQFYGSNSLYIANCEATQWKGAMTILTWIRTTDYHSYQYIVDKWWYSGGDRRAWSLNLAGNNIWWRGIGDGGEHRAIYNLASLYPESDPQWVHIAATYDEVNLKLYIDSELVKTVAHTDNRSTTKPIQIGSGNNGNDYEYRGFIDELVILNRALSQKEIQNHYEAGGGVLE
ncbi:MAG: LamG-like jellyroll fold domain-containing protein [Verrucomicrobiota bacterium]|nr:LamG-like jellyroll fold domain-containing protein [Verrucomicrobiota bacterium]